MEQILGLFSHIIRIFMKNNLHKLGKESDVVTQESHYGKLMSDGRTYSNDLLMTDYTNQMPTAIKLGKNK